MTILETVRVGPKDDGARMLRVMGAEIFCRDEGRGRPLVFLHGHPTSADLWRGLIGDLKRDFRCISLDLPGFARSQRPANFRYDLRSFSFFLSQFLDALGLSEPIHLVLHDIGGPLGLACAIDLQRVGRIAVMNASFSSDHPWHWRARLWRTPIVGETVMAWLPKRAFVKTFNLSRGRLPRPLIDHFWHSYHPQSRVTALQVYRALAAENLRPWRAKLRKLSRQVPIKVLWGREDPFIDVAESYRFFSGDVEHFDGLGHWLPAESPTEVAHRLRLFFLRPNVGLGLAV